MMKVVRMKVSLVGVFLFYSSIDILKVIILSFILA